MMRLRIGAPVGPLLLALAAAQGVIALLFFIRAPVAISVWPLPETGEMTLMLVSSILAAAAASTTWAVLWGEPGSLVGIALDYLVIFAPLSIFALTLDPARGGGSVMFVGVALGGVVMGLGLLWWSSRQPLRDPRPTPRSLRSAFVIFVVALVLAGGSLVAQVPGILPWALTPELSLVAGVMFLGAASYFAYAVARPRWSNAGGQLAGFLAYDLVLIVPLLTRSGTLYGGWTVNLGIYTAVIIGSGVLAAYYLFLAPDTRMFRSRSVDSGAAT